MPWLKISFEKRPKYTHWHYSDDTFSSFSFGATKNERDEKCSLYTHGVLPRLLILMTSTVCHDCRKMAAKVKPKQLRRLLVAGCSLGHKTLPPLPVSKWDMHDGPKKKNKSASKEGRESKIHSGHPMYKDWALYRLGQGWTPTHGPLQHVVPSLPPFLSYIRLFNKGN